MRKISQNLQKFLPKLLPGQKQEKLRTTLTNKKNIPIITAITILIIATLWLITGSEKTIITAGNNKNPQTETNNPTTQIQTVRSFISRTRNFQPRLKLTGQTTPNRILNIKSEISGKVENIPVNIGTVVKQGELLLQFAVEDRQAQLKEAEAEARQMNKEYEIIKQLGEQGFKAEIAVLKAETEQASAEAKLAKMQKEFRHIEIRAPYKAVITAKHAEVGDYLQQGQQALSLMEADPLLLKVQISERNFYNVKVGQTVKVKLADNITTATIRTVAPAADEQTRTFAIEAAIHNPDYKYPIGSTASVEIELPPQKAHRVKSSHLSLNDQGIVGIKILQQNTARFQPVNIIGDQNGIIWINGNLPDEITVIGDGQGFITDGQNVITTPTLPETLPETTTETPDGNN